MIRDVRIPAVKGGKAEIARNRRVTLADIAREAGVSVATASRTLNGSPASTVGETTRARVEEAAERLGYHANATAQAIGKGPGPTVALVVPDIQDRYFARIAHGVIAEAAASGIAVTVTAVDSYPGAPFERLRSLRGQRPGGLIVADPSTGDPEPRTRLIEELEAYRRAGVPVAVTGSEDLGFPSVVFTEREGAADLVRLLVERGYRSPVLLAGTTGRPAVARRVRGLQEALAQAGTAPLRCVETGLSRDAGLRAVLDLPDSVLSRCDVLVCVNDPLAFGAATALRRRGVRVGTDIGVSGFGDIPGATDVRPGLTTVRLPLAEAGARAFRLVSGSPAVRHVVLEATAVARASTPHR